MKTMGIGCVVLLSCFPVSAQQNTFTKTERAAFNAVKRLPMVRFEGDSFGFEMRKLDAEKALDEAEDAATTPQQKSTVKLLRATEIMRELTTVNMKYGDVALQCSYETSQLFRPAELTPGQVEKAKRHTCLADYEKIGKKN